MPQTQEVNQVAKALAEFEEKIRPAVLLDSLANRDLFVGWCRKNRITIPTVANLIQCVKDLRDHLEWKVAPRKRGDVQAEKDTSRKNHAAKEDETWGQGGSIMRDAVTKVDHGKATTELRTVRSTISAHCGRTHAATYRQRGELENTLNNLLKQFPEPTLTLKQAEFIKSQINVVRNGFPE
jgi:hypothetical protein